MRGSSPIHQNNSASRGNERMRAYMVVAVITLACSSTAVVLPSPLGYTSPEQLRSAAKPVPEWAKAHPRLTTEQTSNLVHSCKKDLHTQGCVTRCEKNLSASQTQGVEHICNKSAHNPRCVKKCVINTTEIKPAGWPPPWYIRNGYEVPRRDRQAETQLMNRLYNRPVEPGKTSR